MHSPVKETINTPRGTRKAPRRRWHFIKEKNTDKSWSEVRDGGNVRNSKFVPVARVGFEGERKADAWCQIMEGLRAPLGTINLNCRRSAIKRKQGPKTTGTSNSTSRNYPAALPYARG